MVRYVFILCVIATCLILSTIYWAHKALLFVIGLGIIEAVFALSWNFLFRFSGIASFGHATFFAIGGYTTGYILKNSVFDGGLGFFAALLISACFGALAAFIIGFVALRRNTGITFAIITLAVSEIAVRIISYTNALGRDDGMSSIPRPVLRIGGHTVDLTSDNSYFVFMTLFCMLLVVLLWITVQSEYGRVMRAISFDPERARFLGIDVRSYRISALVISGTIASLVGAVATPWIRIITPETANYIHSTQPMLSSLLGGYTYFWGAPLGAAVFIGISYGTRRLAGLSDLITGGVLLAIVLLMPMGIAGVIARLSRKSTVGRSHFLAHFMRASRAAD